MVHKVALGRFFSQHTSVPVSISPLTLCTHSFMPPTLYKLAADSCQTAHFKPCAGYQDLKLRPQKVVPWIDPLLCFLPTLHLPIFPSSCWVLFTWMLLVITVCSSVVCLKMHWTDFNPVWNKLLPNSTFLYLCALLCKILYVYIGELSLKVLQTILWPVSSIHLQFV